MPALATGFGTAVPAASNPALNRRHVIQRRLCVTSETLLLCVASGWVTSFTEKPSSTAAAIMPACVPSAASACPSSTRKPASPRTTATSGWSGIIADQVRFTGTRTRTSFFFFFLALRVQSCASTCMSVKWLMIAQSALHVSTQYV